VTLSKNFEALEFARSLDISVAVNIIADPAWDRERFKVVRDWCLEIPEVVNISINTPYPGTETWRTESRRLTTRDYRLFDIQHAVLPTKLPLPDFTRSLSTLSESFPINILDGPPFETVRASLRGNYFADRPISSGCFGSSTASIIRSCNSQITVNR